MNTNEQPNNKKKSILTSFDESITNINNSSNDHINIDINPNPTT